MKSGIWWVRICSRILCKYAYIIWLAWQLWQSPIRDLNYELVVLHPKHFLPNSTDLTVFHRVDNNNLNKKSYVVGHDHVLREAPGVPASPCFCPFSPPQRASSLLPFNPFLVIINAEINFRHYLRQIQSQPLSTDVIFLEAKNITSGYTFIRDGCR